MQHYIAVLRSINVGGKNKLPMADLRLLAGELGWQAAKTYIQSGNLVFRAEETEAALEVQLELALKQRFDLTVPVMIRSLKAWQGFVTHNPFPEASFTTPNKVMLGLSKNPAVSTAVDALKERATQGETIIAGDGCLYAHFPQGVGRSKLTTALFDRLVGSKVTMRNWRTAAKLEALAKEL